MRKFTTYPGIWILVFLCILLGSQGLAPETVWAAVDQSQKLDTADSLIRTALTATQLNTSQPLSAIPTPVFLACHDWNPCSPTQGHHNRWRGCKKKWGHGGWKRPKKYGNKGQNSHNASGKNSSQWQNSHNASAKNSSQWQNSHNASAKNSSQWQKPKSDWGKH